MPARRGEPAPVAIPSPGRCGAYGRGRRNLTPTGLKDWRDTEIARAIREGKSRDGSPLRPPMAYAWYRNIDDADMKALIAYLRSLKPLPMGGAAAPAK